MRAGSNPRDLTAEPAIVRTMHRFRRTAFDLEVNTVDQGRPKTKENPALGDHGAEHHICHAKSSDEIGRLL
jgi:hypothetical protein